MDVNEHDPPSYRLRARQARSMRKPKPGTDTQGPRPEPQEDRQGGDLLPRKGYTASGKKIGRPRTRPIGEPSERKGEGGRPTGTGGKYTRYKDRFSRVPEDAVPMDPEVAVQLERSIGQKIAGYRQSQGYTARDVADRLRIHPTQLSAMESGKRRMTLPVLYRVASVLQVPVSDLFRPTVHSSLTTAVVAEFAQRVHRGASALLKERGDVPFTLALLKDLVEFIQQTDERKPEEHEES